jgi:hypothetical protein
MAMQNLFESELADDGGLDGAEESFEDELDDADLGAEDPLEEAFADEADDDGFEDDSFEDDGFEDDGFEDDADDEALESASFEDDDGFEDDGFEDDAADEDGLDEGDDAGDALDEAFADAMDAADEEEFARRVTSRLSRIRRIARPYLRQMAKRAVPIGLRLIRHVARMGGGRNPSRLDAMDAFADAAADEAAAGRSPEAYIPFLAGLAGRYVTNAILRASGRRVRPGAARALGRAVTKATRKAARGLVRKRGPGALRSVPRIVRKVAKIARQRPGAVRKVPRMIGRAASRVAASPRAVARLSKRSPVVRRVRASAGVEGLGGIAPARRPRKRSLAGLQRAL